MNPNLKYMNDIYSICKELEIVKNQYQFSRMCGRTPAWYSTCKARDLSPSTDAIVRLSLNLGKASKKHTQTSQEPLLAILNQSVSMLLSHRMLCED